jgi:hypothetical protein
MHTRVVEARLAVLQRRQEPLDQQQLSGCGAARLLRILHGTAAVAEDGPDLAERWPARVSQAVRQQAPRADDLVAAAPLPSCLVGCPQLGVTGLDAGVGVSNRVQRGCHVALLPGEARRSHLLACPAPPPPEGVAPPRRRVGDAVPCSPHILGAPRDGVAAAGHAACRNMHTRGNTPVWA